MFVGRRATVLSMHALLLLVTLLAAPPAAFLDDLDAALCVAGERPVLVLVEADW